MADQEFVPNHYLEGNNVMSTHDNYFSNIAGCQHSDISYGPQKKLPNPILSFAIAIAQLRDIQVLHFPLFFAKS